MRSGNCLRAAGASLLLWTSMAATEALGQVQTKGQQSCLTAVARSARKVSGTVLKEAVPCIRKGAAGKLPFGQTAQQCLSADLKGKVAKARNGVATSDSKFCAVHPDFAYEGATTTGIAYANQNLALSEDAFGPNLDATLAASNGVDRTGKCTSALPNGWRKIEDTMHRLFESCLKNGLRSEGITDRAGVEACYASISDDLRGRVAKSAATLTKQLQSKCPAGSLATMFPGLVPICSVYGSSVDAAGLAPCSRDRLECRTCLMLNSAYDLDRDCDDFDDGLGNGSCPFCGNTVVDSGEGCDDGNEVSGDGCTANCIDEFCGDGVINDGDAEECDDGPANSDTLPGACRTNCKVAGCGDGVIDSGNGEQCDDGNTEDGDCCDSDCHYEILGSPCEGTAGACVAPACDGAGVCLELPANEGTECDDGDTCTAESTCQSGSCTATVSSAVGQACNWVIVAKSNRPARPATMVTLSGMQSVGGDWCGQLADISINSVFARDLIATGSDSAGRSMLFSSNVNVDGGDIVTGGGRIEAYDNLTFLPGVATWTVPSGQVLPKTPVPTFYDTTGSDSRLAKCLAAQSAIATAAANIAALPSTFDYGNTYRDLPTGAAPPIVASNVGGLNVFDMTRLSGSAPNVTITLDGGGSTDTVMILRISQRFNTGQYWVFNFVNGMTPDHVLYYVTQSTGDEACSVGLDNTGGGTMLCPDMQAKILSGTTWYGAAYGGDSGLNPRVLVQESTLIYTPFTAGLP
jgi:cysteine-rich repeat protein